MATRIGSVGSMVSMCFLFCLSAWINETALYGQTAQPTDLAFLTNGLVAYYPFYGDAKDESGNGNDGQVSQATLATDRFGTPNACYSFDGVSSYIDTTDIKFHDSFCISVWVNPIGVYGSLVSKQGDPMPSYELIYNNDPSYGIYGVTGAVSDSNNA